MKKKKIKAVFKGKDGSCGYKTGMEYTLNLKHKLGANIEISKTDICANVVEYSSMITFLNNWDNIRVL